ncbi:MAG: hypothetical protein KDC98_19980 [Planctomycetes bacterium]|nr:hypothetical protein [Planctomycetota bacterium]
MFGKLRWSRCGKGEDARRLHKAQLCASCHAMHGFSGRSTSLLANYDQSLLVMVLAAVAGGAIEERRCTALPWRRVGVQDLPPALRVFVAAGNLVLIDAKLRDDIEDGGRCYARLARLVLGRKVRRAERELRRLGFAVELVTALPARQAAVEHASATGLAELAEPSAELLAAMFVHGGRLAGQDGDTSETSLRRFGHAVGRAVYAFDALDDHDDDRRRGHFNAVARLGERTGHQAAVAATQRFVELATVEALQAAAQLLPEDRLAIVGSILQQLAQRAMRRGEELLGRPGLATLRPAEAGDCDCACDGCDGCDCACHDGPGCCDCDGCGSCGD